MVHAFHDSDNPVAWLAEVKARFICGLPPLRGGRCLAQAVDIVNDLLEL